MLNVFQAIQAARSHDAVGIAIRNAVRQHNLNGDFLIKRLQLQFLTTCGLQVSLQLWLQS